jgi:hypothetical protein
MKKPREPLVLVSAGLGSRNIVTVSDAAITYLVELVYQVGNVSR